MSTSLSADDRNRLFTRLASVEIKIAALPINRYEPVMGAISVISPQEIIDDVAAVEKLAQRMAVEFMDNLLLHLKGTETFDVKESQLREVNLRG